MKVDVKINKTGLKQVDHSVRDALKKTADAVLTDLVQAQTVPFDTGHLQNNATYVDDSDVAQGKVYIVSDTPYARRLYFHPEYNYQRTKNPNAGAGWFDPYISGTKKDYAKKVFQRFMKGG